MNMDLMQQQVKALETWRVREEDKLRHVVKALLIGVVLIAIGAGGGIWRVQNLADDNLRLSQQTASLTQANANLIGQINNLNQAQANQAFNECEDRNQRAKASTDVLAQLVQANIKDKNPASVDVWQKYLDVAKKNKLPPCIRPK